MEDKKLQDIVESLFLIPPLFNKKLVKYDIYEDIDLTLPHFQAMFILEETGVMSVTELAKALMVSKPNVTPIVQKLVDKDFVERFQDKKDRRYIYIKLTESGTDFLSKHKDIVTEGLKKKLSSISKRDLEKLAIALTDLKDILGKIE
ncbi:MarR family winged helix-turn-helix transcriptional regulator [Clostridium omnivorum]|uniref:MarR family transcriptional regulator n=1 Tax=Clostridium omnivorum TaxID=1604902 RepID=A0ABQ5N4L7_9CLOT|nr:MarR family transcriptional regulator [Clostridium sp. E14]GLC30069.1 MarR family transcriptional regulator [Clostridium sp. E14]